MALRRTIVGGIVLAALFTVPAEAARLCAGPAAGMGACIETDTEEGTFRYECSLQAVGCYGGGIVGVDPKGPGAGIKYGAFHGSILGGNSSFFTAVIYGDDVLLYTGHQLNVCAMGACAAHLYPEFRITHFPTHSEVWTCEGLTTGGCAYVRAWPSDGFSNVEARAFTSEGGYGKPHMLARVSVADRGADSSASLTIQSGDQRQCLSVSAEGPSDC